MIMNSTEALFKNTYNNLIKQTKEIIEVSMKSHLNAINSICKCFLPLIFDALYHPLNELYNELG